MVIDKFHRSSMDSSAALSRKRLMVADSSGLKVLAARQSSGGRYVDI
jgi:hypothetical protein